MPFFPSSSARDHHYYHEGNPVLAIFHLHCRRPSFPISIPTSNTLTSTMHRRSSGPAPTASATQTSPTSTLPTPFVTIIVLTTRKPTISPATFRARYDAFVDLLKVLLGDTFPLCHRRSFIAHPEHSSSQPSVSSRPNWLAPPLREPGRHQHAAVLETGFDCVAELTFADQEAYERWSARNQEPDVASQLTVAVESFMDRAAVMMAYVGDVKETRGERRRSREGYGDQDEDMDRDGDGYGNGYREDEDEDEG
ncbi:hypothetical protein BDW74DRAFT_181793 [Aspergillus multicolor]|uniref:uncharacterized protein n=1 Tax=Aspergillus multicolor TaxID=41759 RepID=UPI003CCC92F2